MKQIDRLQLLTCWILISFTMISCIENDPDPLPGNNLPTSTLKDNPISATSLIGPNTTLTVISGDSPLDILSVSKNGSNDFMDDISIDGSAYTTELITLSETDKTSFAYDVKFNLIAGTGGTFTFVATAENGDETSQTLSIDVKPDLRLPSGESKLTCPSSSLKTLKFSGLLGTSELYSLGVYENGEILDLSRLRFGSSVASANPILLENDQINGFTEEITFRTHDDDTNKIYAFVLVDSDGLEDRVSIDISSN